MRDIALNQDTGDIVTPLRYVEGAECFAQRIRIRYKFFKGDWFLNPEEGIPYIEEILEKGIPQVRLDSIFRLVVESTPGCDSLLTFTTALDTANRIVNVSFTAIFDGTVIAMEEDFLI